MEGRPKRLPRHPTTNHAIDRAAMATSNFRMAALAHAGLVTVRALSTWAGPRTDSTLEEGADITAGMVLRVSLSGFIEPCLPTRAERPPSGPGWVHEIKHDGFRMVVRRDPAGVRLMTRRG